MRVWVAAGAVVACLAVAAGAFGAHALKGRLDPERLAIFETAVRYAFYHAFGLMIAGIVAGEERSLRWAGWSFLAGVVLFSGTLAVLALTGWRWLGALTPFGGILFMIGWLFLAWGVMKKRPA